MKRLFSLFSLFFFLISLSVHSNEIYVSTSGSDILGDGSSTNPFASVQYAVNSASEFDTISVAAGLYSEHVNFNGKNLTLISADGMGKAVLEAVQSAVPVVTFSSGEKRGSVLDGFTIRNSVDAPGILCLNSAPVIQNCQITDCSNSGAGGGIYCEGSSPLISNNIFKNNSATSGGAIAVNSGSDLDLSYNLFTYNQASQNGGAIADISSYGSTLLIKFCTFYQNSSGQYGGALFTQSLLMIVERSILWNDTAQVAGNEVNSQLFPALVTYCDIYGGWSGSGNGNSNIDPAFCDVTNDDFHLQEGSYLATYPPNGGNPIGAFDAGCVEADCSDIDSDGVCDEVDNCPENANTGQEDADGDGVGDVCDNCPDVANSGQDDADNDGVGDACTVVYSSIFGYVQNDGSPVETVNVSLLDADANEINSTATNSDGYYSFDDHSPGSYFVHLWAPAGYTADKEVKEVALNESDVQIDFVLTQMEVTDEWRGLGYWKHQVRTHLTGQGKPHESYEDMCNYMEMIRDYFNSNPDIPVLSYVVDSTEDCDQRLKNLQQALETKTKVTLLNRSTSEFLVLLLNIVSGRIEPDAALNNVAPADKGKLSASSSKSITVSQAVAYTDLLNSDFDESNDNLAYLIVRLVNNGEAVPDGWIDPATPDINYLASSAADNESENLPSGYRLSQNYPNPFNPATNISFNIPKSSDVTLEIYNINGQIVDILINDHLQAGEYVVSWNGINAASGIYFYRLDTGDYSAQKKMVLLK